MKPEHGADEFLDQCRPPVAARRMQQFVAQHRALHVGLEPPHAGRQKNDGPAEPERHGLGNRVVPADVRGGSELMA